MQGDLSSKCYQSSFSHSARIRIPASFRLDSLQLDDDKAWVRCRIVLIAYPLLEILQNWFEFRITLGVAFLSSGYGSRLLSPSHKTCVIAIIIFSISIDVTSRMPTFSQFLNAFQHCSKQTQLSGTSPSRNTTLLLDDECPLPCFSCRSTENTNSSPTSF